MDSILLYALPKTEPWTLERFLDEIKKACEKSDPQGLVDIGIEKPASLNQLIAEAKRVQGIVTGVFAALEAC